jgi:hypothetical protein
VDDSVLQQNRSKKAELLARVFDHTTGRFVKGFNMLTLGWSDGFSFAPIDFVMLSSANIKIGFARWWKKSTNAVKITSGALKLSLANRMLLSISLTAQFLPDSALTSC